MSGTPMRDRPIAALVGAGLLAGLGVLVVGCLAALSLGWDPGFTVQDFEDTIVPRPTRAAGSLESRRACRPACPERPSP